MKRPYFLLMTAAIAVLITGIATFSACNKDDDKKDKSEQQKQQDATPQDYVDLGLESGTLWKEQNESGQDFYTYEEAVAQFRHKLPTIEQWGELLYSCQWRWSSPTKRYVVTGPNGNSIFLPAAGYRERDGRTCDIGSAGYYWSSTPHPDYSDCALGLWFNYNKNECRTAYGGRCNGKSVRLVQN